MGVYRLALRPFTFSNGVTIPAGTLVALPKRALHTDGDIYSNPDEFDGFRFSKLREQEGDAMVGTHQTVSTSSEHIAFGLGRHQWLVISASFVPSHPAYLYSIRQPWTVPGGHRIKGVARTYRCNI